MSQSFQKVQVGLSARQKLADKLRLQAPLLSFDEDPSLSALCTILGLQFELGRPSFDRLSPFLGIEVAEGKESPFLTQVISKDDKLGLQITRGDRQNFQLRHPDFRYIIDRDSFDSNGNLSQILLFPVDVFQNYKQRGFELVVVRDWVKTSSLNLDAETVVGYLYTNRWEFENNVAKTQLALMEKRQLAFSGTHDIVDHLLGANEKEYSGTSALLKQVREAYDRVFPEGKRATEPQLALSYLIGVLLDDLGQPRWYRSSQHESIIRLALLKLENASFAQDIKVEFKDSFKTLVEEIRSEGPSMLSLQVRFQEFLSDTVPIHTLN